MLRMKHEMEPGRAVFGNCGASQTGGRNQKSSPLRQAQAGLTAKNAVRMGHPSTSEASERIDEVVVTYFAKPHSYTTDDIIEISAHGSPVV